MLDIVIKNGRVLDLEKNLLRDVQVGVKDGKIAALGGDMPEAAQVIDAGGRIVSPGFIDIHIHEEDFSLTGTEETDISDCMLRMGVTTAVIGNCGHNRQELCEVEAAIKRRGNPVNFMGYIGLNHLRNSVGNKDSQAESTPEQIELMARMVRDSVDDGALGLSYGIEYCKGMSFKEEVGACKYIMNRDDLLLAAHYRDDAAGALDAIEEMARICEATGIAFQVSHLSSCSAFGNMKQALDLIGQKRAEGLDMLADAYPYNAFSATIGSDVYLPGCFERWGVSPDAIELTEPPYENVRCTPEIFEDARANYPYMYTIAHVMNEDDISYAMGHPLVMVASDGVYRNRKGHPRGAGTFPRFLGKYVRDEKVCDFYTGMHKITSMPAKRLRLWGRKGDIKKGWDADITVFDYDTIMDRAGFGGNAQLPPEGIGWVIVNGKVALEGTRIIDGSCGGYIRRP